MHQLGAVHGRTRLKRMDLLFNLKLLMVSMEKLSVNGNWLLKTTLLAQPSRSLTPTISLVTTCTGLSGVIKVFSRLLVSCHQLKELNSSLEPTLKEQMEKFIQTPLKQSVPSPEQTTSVQTVSDSCRLKLLHQPIDPLITLLPVPSEKSLTTQVP